MSDYVYRDLLKEGYTKIKLTPKKQRDIFRSYNKIVKYEVYENEYTFVRERYIPLLLKIAYVLIYPILLLIHGLGSIKELNKEMYSLFNEKKTGHFLQARSYKSDLRKRNIDYMDR